VTAVAVVAHRKKTLGGGLPALRRALEDAGATIVSWAEVPKSRKAPARVVRALDEGAEQIIVWGGDGSVQRSIDVLAGTGVPLAIIPAGTANLLARNLGIPIDLEAAVDVAVNGGIRAIDVGTLNGERFAVMAGAGFDARMISSADGSLKRRLGRASYVLAGARAVKAGRFGAHIRVDGTTWHEGPVGSILAGNVGNLFAGVQVFADARPDDGLLDVGIVTAESVAQWGRTVGRALVADVADSPFVHVTTAREVEIELDRKVRYEIDGGDRKKVRSLRLAVEPGAVRVRVPQMTD
jgi:YegS/Rv2252/BmrU family lipid kinase